MKKLFLTIPLLLIACGGNNQTTICVNEQNVQISCPVKKVTPEEQTRTTYVTTAEGCKIYYVQTPGKYSNVFLSKCNDGTSSVQYQDGGNPISNSTSIEHATAISKRPSLNNLVETEQKLKQVIGKLTLEDRRLLLDSADAVQNTGN